MNKNALISEMTEFFDTHQDIANAWDEYIKSVNKEAGILARDFDREKQAFISARAGSVQSGTLDVTRLSEYKTSDELFSRTKVLPEGKNHKFYVTLDWSGSMSEMAFEAMKQTVTQAAFLRKLKIEHFITMFGYNDRYNMTDEETAERELEEEQIAKGSIKQQNTHILELFNDSMSNTEYMLSAKLCFLISQYVGYASKNRELRYTLENCNQRLVRDAVRNADMGGTPLNAHLCELRGIMAKDHVVNPSVQQNLLIISDGASSTLEVKIDNWREEQNYSDSSLRFQADGKSKTFPKTLLGSGLGNNRLETYGLISTFDWGVNTMFLFLTHTAEKYQVQQLMGSYMFNKHIEEDYKQIAAGKILSVKNLYGCIDSVIYVACGVKRRSDGTDSNKLVEEGATAGKIRQAMKKEAMSNPIQYLSSVLAEAAAVNYSLNKHTKSQKQNARVLSKGFDDGYWKRMVTFLEGDAA